MGRVALQETQLPSQHVYRSLRRLQAKRGREEKMLSLQLEIGQLRFENSKLHSELSLWQQWYYDQCHTEATEYCPGFQHQHPDINMSCPEDVPDATSYLDAATDADPSAQLDLVLEALQEPTEPAPPSQPNATHAAEVNLAYAQRLLDFVDQTTAQITSGIVYLRSNLAENLPELAGLSLEQLGASRHSLQDSPTFRTDITKMLHLNNKLTEIRLLRNAGDQLLGTGASAELASWTANAETWIQNLRRDLAQTSE